jgi:hypothetical protein
MLHCDVVGCDNVTGFSRRDNLMRHQRNQHPHLFQSFVPPLSKQIVRPKPTIPDDIPNETHSQASSADEPEDESECKEENTEEPARPPRQVLKAESVLSEDSGEENERRRKYERKKKRWSAGIFKRIHSQSVEGDSSYSDNDPLDDVDATARRLRRRVRGPGGRAPLIFEDKGFANSNNIVKVEEPDDRHIPHSNGPPSIPSDDGFRLDELPFWDVVEDDDSDNMDVNEEEEDDESKNEGSNEDMRPPLEFIKPIGQGPHFLFSPPQSRASSRPSSASGQVYPTSNQDSEDESEFNKESTKEPVRSPLRQTQALSTNVLAFLSSIGLGEKCIPPGHQRIWWTNVSVFVAVSFSHSSFIKTT